MRYLTLQTLTWATVATAVVSAVWLAAAGGPATSVGGPDDRRACGVKACTVLATRAPSAKAPASTDAR